MLHKSVEGLSNRTIETYQHQLTHLCQYLDDPPLARVTADLWNAESEGPEQQALRREEIESFLTVFATLPLRDRQLILMKDVDDFSIGEIAEILGVPAGTVKSRLHRARERLIATARRAR